MKNYQADLEISPEEKTKEMDPQMTEAFNFWTCNLLLLCSKKINDKVEHYTIELGLIKKK